MNSPKDTKEGYRVFTHEYEEGNEKKATEAYMLDAPHDEGEKKVLVGLVNNAKFDPSKPAVGSFSYLSPEYRKKQAAAGFDGYIQALNKIIKENPETTEANIAEALKDELSKRFKEDLIELERAQKQTKKEEGDIDQIRERIFAGKLDSSKFVGKEIKKSVIKKEIKEILEGMDPQAAEGDEFSTEEFIQNLKEAQGKIETALHLNEEDQPEIDLSAVDGVIRQAREGQEKTLNKSLTSKTTPATGFGEALATAVNGTTLPKGTLPPATPAPTEKPKATKAPAQGGFGARLGGETTQGKEASQETQETETEEDAASRARFEETLKTIKNPIGRMVSIQEKDAIVVYSVKAWNKDKNKYELQRFPQTAEGGSIFMPAWQVKEFIALQEIAYQDAAAEREAKKREEKERKTKAAEQKASPQPQEKKEVRTLLDLFREYQNTPEATQPTAEQEIAQVMRKRFELEEVVSFYDKETGKITKWKVVALPKRGVPARITIKNEAGRELSLSPWKLRKIVASAINGKPSQEVETNESTIEFKVGKVLRLPDGKHINNWEIVNITKSKSGTFITVKNDDFGVRTELETRLRSLAEDAARYEKEQETLKNKQETIDERIKPITQLVAKFINNPDEQGRLKGLDAWMREWFVLNSGERPIDRFRKDHGTVELDQEIEDFVKEALPIYVEAIKIPTLSKDRKTSMTQTIRTFVGILTGVQHPKLNNIEPTLKNWRTLPPTGDYEIAIKDLRDFQEGKGVVPERKPLRPVTQTTTRIQKQPTAAQESPAPAQPEKSPIILDEWAQIKEQTQKNADARAAVQSAPRPLSRNETLEIFKAAYTQDPETFLKIYTEEETSPERGTYRIQSETMIANPYRDVIERVLQQNNIPVYKSEVTPAPRDTDAEEDALLAQARDRLTAQKGREIPQPAVKQTVPQQQPQIPDSGSTRPEQPEQTTEPQPENTTGEQTPEEKRETVKNAADIIKVREGRVPKSWKSFIRPILLAATAAGIIGGTAILSKKSGTETPEVVPVATAQAGMEIERKTWAKVMQRLKDPSDARYGIFAKDWKDAIANPNVKDEDIMRKYVPSHFAGSNDPSKMTIALGWLGEKLVHDNTDLFGHLSDNERRELIALWEILQDTSMATSGEPLRAATYKEAIQEIKQKVTKKESEATALKSAVPIFPSAEEQLRRAAEQSATSPETPAAPTYNEEIKNDAQKLSIDEFAGKYAKLLGIDERDFLGSTMAQLTTNNPSNEKLLTFLKQFEETEKAIAPTKDRTTETMYSHVLALQEANQTNA